ncbi:MAG: helix-turn-helix transcriptional regulator [Burkholderiales bacterium]
MSRASQAPLKVLRRREVQLRTGLPCSSLYALIAQGDFPQPIPLSINRVGWLEHEIDDWIMRRANSRNAG